MTLQSKELLVDRLDGEVGLDRSLEECLEAGEGVIGRVSQPYKAVGDTNTCTSNALVNAIARSSGVKHRQRRSVGCIDPARWTSIRIEAGELIIVHTERCTNELQGSIGKFNGEPEVGLEATHCIELTTARWPKALG